ncbi:MAG: replication-associated recombination protein A [Magnetococcales bacterium]|nr:replication-associated recombination protein A [Magnetococcales bacterium]
MPATNPKPPLQSPLADRMRPVSLDEVVGQEDWIGPGKFLTEALASHQIPSLILWGPPGCGKTTIAGLIAQLLTRDDHYRCVTLSAVWSGVRDIRAVIERAQLDRRAGQRTLLFVDEIHRFNKGQQDAFLPFVEQGIITLVGATTENPSFELNGALLSRCRVLVLKPLSDPSLRQLLQRALTDQQQGLGALQCTMDPPLLEQLVQMSAGDGRTALNLLENLVLTHNQSSSPGQSPLGLADLERSLSHRAPLYDKSGENHYNLISALHKSLRGSDVDAALYWLARMLSAGEDGLYIARRMVRFACEDIGNADPQALTIALQTKETYHFLGAPEGELALAQAVVYLATAPKSNSVYVAYQAARKAAEQTSQLAPPLHLCNAITPLMQSLGYGSGYRYAHDYEGGWVAQDYLPESLRDRRFYQPVERGFEREIARRLNYWQKRKQDQQD